MSRLKYSPIVHINEIKRDSFSAFQGRHQALGELMSPVSGFDHFRMNKDVFGAHRHVHMSAGGMKFASFEFLISCLT